MRTIDADKLVDMLYDNEFAVLCPLDEVSGVVDACPTVDAMPVVHGRWGHLGGDEWCCSACGFVICQFRRSNSNSLCYWRRWW